MTFRAINPTAAKIYYALEADRPVSTLNIPDGSLVIFTDSGLEDSFDAVANAWFNREQITQTSSGEAAGLVVAETLYPKRFSVAPTISGAATPERTLTAAASNAVLSARVTLNALDIVSAGVAIKNRTPDVKAIEVGEVVTIESDEAITKIYATGLSTAANVGGDVITLGETDEILIRAELILFEFEAGDNVKTVEISLGSANNALSSATVPTPLTAVLRVEGFSHA